jgi:alanyl-tRNA synthetase
MPTGSEIREKFLHFFESKGHKRVHSSSLVPANDPTLLFTNAGMNQFKDVFLGVEKRDYNKATTSQKCVRAGGKHNDLENVGFTNRHHTFFEMLGNFSFGDYFKKEAIEYAWELLTSKDWFGIDKSKLYFTIFQGEGDIPRDDEAEKYWLEVGAPKERIFAMGMKDNFWSMGDTGPCGPCSEIHYDMGPAASDEGHPDCMFPCDCGRYVEIWNLVFMQFNRESIKQPVPDPGIPGLEIKEFGYIYHPLPKPSIDTGMGLERLAAVLQGVISNYDTDLFIPLIKRAAELTHDQNQFGAGSSGYKASLRIIADHSRAATFLISDGVLPANEGRGYVLRKILRRAIRHGRALGQDKPFMFQMVYAVSDQMANAYPELGETADHVSQVIQAEEGQFQRVLYDGSQKFDTAAYEAKLRHFQEVAHAYRAERNLAIQQSAVDAVARQYAGAYTRAQERHAAASELAWDVAFDSTARKELIALLDQSQATLDGRVAFQLYETYGLPLDFMIDAARDQGIQFDQEGFEIARAGEQARARASWKGGAGKATASPVYRDLNKTVFEGYRQTESKGSEVLAIVHNGAGVRELRAGEEGEVVLDHTPFYADSGGQVGDIGILYDDTHSSIVADVNGCYMPVQGVRAHKVKARQPILVGMKVDPVVHVEVRDSTKRNHTATHLLHAALRETLGDHVKQAGSLVDPGHLRFDFSHFAAVADEELQDIEDLMNKHVLRNTPVDTIENVPIDVAINEYKAMALFGEKYGDRVRVVKIGEFSAELCGGTHTHATGEIGLIKIMSEGSVSSGVRRVEAISGEGSLKHFRMDHKLENLVSSLIPQTKSHSPAEALRGELDKKDAEIKKLQKELEQLRMKSAGSQVASVGDKARDIKGVKVVAQRVDNLDRGQMRTLVDNMRNKLGSGVVVLGSVQDGKVALVVGVTADLTARLQAGKIIKPVAEKVGGSGGGRPDMAEAGGKDPAQLDAALNEAYAVVEGLLK